MHVIHDEVKREIMFAVCDTCGAQAMCFDLGEDTHICEACDWAPKIAAEQKARDEELAKLREHNKELVRLLQWARQILPHRHTKIREEIDAALANQCR